MEIKLSTQTDLSAKKSFSSANLTKLLTGGFYSAKLPKALEPEIKEERERNLGERSREQSAENLRQRRERRRI